MPRPAANRFCCCSTGPNARPLPLSTSGRACIAPPRGHQVPAPAEALVDPFAERWQFEAVEATAEPQFSDQPGRLLRMDGAHDAPVRGPYLVRSFPRPPPPRL